VNTRNVVNPLHEKLSSSYTTGTTRVTSQKKDGIYEIIQDKAKLSTRRLVSAKQKSIDAPKIRPSSSYNPSAYTSIATTKNAEDQSQMSNRLQNSNLRPKIGGTTSTPKITI
jgi:hypothetical protein